MSPFTVDPDIARLVRNFKLPEPLGFGQCLAPILFRTDYENGRWGPGRLLPYGPLAVDPAAKVLHYAQVVFEGLKAYCVEQPRPALFRPELNRRRLNASARRMMLPELPEELFMEGLFATAGYSQPYIPRQSGRSLYLRPLLFGTEPALGHAPSRTATFLVIASPSEAFAPGPLRVRVEREGCRAAPGGTGAVKVSGNYGASLQATAAARESGFTQPLWLDAESHRYIEELSVMNFFAVIDGELHTPALTDTILPGVTRASIIELARAGGLGVHERRIPIDDLLSDIASGRCTEAFACGTAVIIGSISAVADGDGRVYSLKEAAGGITGRLREELLALQEGRAPDRFGWMRTVPDRFFSENG